MQTTAWGLEIFLAILLSFTRCTTYRELAGTRSLLQLCMTSVLSQLRSTIVVLRAPPERSLQHGTNDSVVSLLARVYLNISIYVNFSSTRVIGVGTKRCPFSVCREALTDLEYVVTPAYWTRGPSGKSGFYTWQRGPRKGYSAHTASALYTNACPHIPQVRIPGLSGKKEMRHCSRLVLECRLQSLALSGTQPSEARTSEQGHLPAGAVVSWLFCSVF
jgi:hypothetical protein